MFGAVQDLLDAHFENHVRMRADPWTHGGDVAQQRIELLARLAVLDRVDPDQHAVDRRELRANLLDHVVGIDGRLGVDAERLKFFEDAMIAIVLRRGRSAHGAVAAPENCDFLA
jgi:hypothetical protein